MVDKYVTVGQRARVGQLVDDGDRPGITTIGKNCQIPNGLVIGRGAQVSPDISADAFPRGGIAAGQVFTKSVEKTSE